MAQQDPNQPAFDKARAEAAFFSGLAEGMTELGEAATTAHELFHSHVEAGFTEPQAIYLIGCMLTGNPGYPPK